MASVQTQRMPQVGFHLDQPFNSSVSIPFKSIRISGRLSRDHGKDNRDAAFWNNSVVAEVGGQRYLAKVYTQSSGGETAFTHDLERLMNDKGSNIPRVFAYADDSATPCILFATSRVVPFHTYLSEMLQVSPETALQDAWQLLIDMKDAAEGLIRNYPSLPSSVLCDALAKASVDDESKIILTPEIVGRPYNSQRSIEELVQTAWAEFFRAGKYRPLRALGYALAGNAHAVLGKSPREFKDTTTALQYLQQFWDPPSRRYLSWPSRSGGYFEPGDIGVFEMQPGKGKVFRKLASVSTELGGITRKINASDFEEVQPSVYRATCPPLRNGEVIKPSLDFFILSWSNTLKDSEAEWDWLTANASNLAATHGVSAEDLVLLTKTTHGLDVKSLQSLAGQIQKPIYFYVHMDASGVVFKHYWTFTESPNPVEDQGETPEDPELKGLQLPAVKMHFGERPFPAKYLQLELGDL